MQVVWLWNRHRRCRRLLSAYLDGEVTASERRMVAEHLPECGACTSELEGLKMTVALLRDLPDLPVPRSFTLERAPAPADSGTGLLRAARLATAAVGSLAAVMLVGTMAVGVLTGGADEEAAFDSPAAMAEAAPAQAPVSKAAAPAAPAAPAAAAAMQAAPAPTAAVETSLTPVVAAMAASIPDTAEETEETAATAAETETPAPSPSATPLPSPTVTPAPVEAMSQAAADPRPEEEPSADASWRLPAALGGLLLLFGAATGWLTVLIRRRSL